MSTLTVVDRPEDLGFDRSRLERIGEFLASEYIGSRLMSASVVVARRGQPVYTSFQGLQPDSVLRLYSMTKAMTSVGLMTLYEQGRVRLDDPVSRFIPQWSDLRVYEGGSAAKYTTRSAERPMIVRDLLTHCSGLTYDFLADHPVAEMYKQRGLQGLPGGSLTLGEMVDRLAELPLQFSPGTQWNYSISTDICGHLCEVISGQPLDEFLQSAVFGPLGMADTGFTVRPDQADRLVPLYAYASADQPMYLFDKPESSPFLNKPDFLSGGGGAVGTLGDYHRFVSMLLAGGVLDGERVLGRKTVEYMATNHLPSGGDLASMGRPTFNEAIMTGMGFGLGFSVVIDPARTQVVSSTGEFAWGGAASTYFWVDPVEEITVVLFTQLLPSSQWPIRRELRQLVYQATT